MATKIVKLCDMSGDEIPTDTEAITLRVQNGSQSWAVKLELSETEKTKLFKALKPYQAKGSDADPNIVAPKGATNPETATIRAWAIANGHKVSEKGRVPNAVVEAYRASPDGQDHASEAAINAALDAGEKSSK